MPMGRGHAACGIAHDESPQALAIDVRDGALEDRPDFLEFVCWHARGIESAGRDQSAYGIRELVDPHGGVIGIQGAMALVSRSVRRVVATRQRSTVISFGRAPQITNSSGKSIARWYWRYLGIALREQLIQTDTKA